MNALEKNIIEVVRDNRSGLVEPMRDYLPKHIMEEYIVFLAEKYYGEDVIDSWMIDGEENDEQ